MNLPDLKLFKRNFVSLVITPRHLKAVQVNTKTNTVTKFAQIEIPPGIIVNYRVKDKETLVKLIRELWVKNKIKEKYVGVVVPEFATYTKGLELPNLTDTETREALTWSIQEHLPVAVEEVVFDWKLVQREKEKTKVLTVAILKDVLFSYIDAVAKAGLSPVVVETPSLSIQRIIDKDKISKLIIYVSASEAILVVSTDGEIVATSVVTTGHFENIVSTAHQMLSHYSTLGVNKVMISGVGLTQDLVQFLNYNLGRSVQYADVKIKGLIAAQVQDYLIGISLQYKDPVAPDSDQTINLLPPAWSEYYNKQSRGLRAWTLTLIASVVIWATFLTVFISFMFLSLEAERNKGENGGSAKSDLNEAASEVKAVNSLADSVIAFKSNFIFPEKIINLLTSSKVEGATITYYKLNYETGEIIISGNASTRTVLLDFKNSLQSHEEFSEITLPITSLSQDTDINYEMRFTYKSLVPNKKQPVKLKNDGK